MNERSSLLDALRAVAVGLVLLHHVGTRYDWSELDIVATQFRRYGDLGVDIFFPLSGFLITRYLLKRGASIRRFFLRRVFRIVPLYLVAVVTFLLIARITGYDSAAVDRIWIAFTFLTGWFAFTDRPRNVPYIVTWSISVEEFSYIVFGVSAWIAQRMLHVMLVVCAIGPLALRWWLYSEGYDHVYYFPPARLDSIAIGGLLAMFIHRVPFVAAWLAGLSVVAAGVWQFGGPIGDAALYTFVSLATCTVIALCETSWSGVRSGVLDRLAKVGLYSYFIYLFHLFAIEGLLRGLRSAGFQTPSFWLIGAGSMVITYIAAALSWRWFEKPMIAFGRRVEGPEPAQRNAAPVAAWAGADPTLADVSPVSRVVQLRTDDEPAVQHAPQPEPAGWGAPAEAEPQPSHRLVPWSESWSDDPTVTPTPSPDWAVPWPSPDDSTPADLAPPADQPDDTPTPHGGMPRTEGTVAALRRAVAAVAERV